MTRRLLPSTPPSFVSCVVPTDCVECVASVVPVSEAIRSGTTGRRSPDASSAPAAASQIRTRLPALSDSSRVTGLRAKSRRGSVTAPLYSLSLLHVDAFLTIPRSRETLLSADAPQLPTRHLAFFRVARHGRKLLRSDAHHRRGYPRVDPPPYGDRPSGRRLDEPRGLFAAFLLPLALPHGPYRRGYLPHHLFAQDADFRSSFLRAAWRISYTIAEPKATISSQSATH